MDFSWNAEQERLRERAVEFARNKLKADPIRDEWNESAFRKGWKACAEFGLQGLIAEDKFGGMGLDLLSGMLVMEGMGFGSHDNGLLFSINAQTWSFLSPLLHFGTPEQQARFVPALCRGELIGAHAMSEPEAGSDAKAIRTTATRVAGGYVLNGSKTFVTNGPVADAFLVFARLTDGGSGKGITGFIVDRSAKGLKVGGPIKKMGMNTSAFCEVFLEQCEIPRSSLLGDEGNGFLMFSLAMVEERIFIMAAHVGAMERQLAEAHAYAKTRKQFDRQIKEFQAVSHMLVEMKIALETSKLLLYKAAWLKSSGQKAILESSIAKVHVTESWVKSNLLAMKIHGGYGYTAEFGIERQLRDSVGSLFYSGTSEIQRNIIAGLMD
ncbi:MAG TPA: acyl-CoA dehydrogenase family protein [Bdellovibrionales bacterium]|nr:acyl-CoA dehydrogenase family protein [Bdellovibrionales bacterium]